MGIIDSLLRWYYGGETVKTITDDGDVLFIPKRQWRKLILPQQIELYWHEPDPLYAVLVKAVEVGYWRPMLPFIDRLIAIDTHYERAYSLKSIVYQKLHEPENARKVLETCIEQHGPSPFILINLCKVQVKIDPECDIANLLLQAIIQDPNNETAVEWWSRIFEKKNPEKGYPHALAMLIGQFQHSYRPYLLLARHFLNLDSLEGAVNCYERALQLAGGDPEVILCLAADMNRKKYYKETVRLIQPYFDFYKHGAEAALKYAEACLGASQYGLIDPLLKLINANPKPELVQAVRHFERAYKQRSELQDKPMI